MRRVLPAIALLLAVAGCTRYWARPGGTTAELEAARTRCETEAVTRFPVMPTSVAGSGTIAPTGSVCSAGPAGPACTTYGGTELDLNGQPRSGAFRACLIDAGWLPAKNKGDAEAISRSRQPPAPAETAVREARQWCDKMFYQRRNAAVMEVYHQSVDRCVATHSRDLD